MHKTIRSSSIKIALFPVGGLGTRFLPATKSMPKEMLPIIDRPLIQYAVEEARDSGIEQFIFVTGRGKAVIEDHFDYSFELNQMLQEQEKESYLRSTKQMIFEPGRLVYLRQQSPLGLGHAVWCARKLIKNEPFAVILADDLIRGETPCLKQMIDAYEGGNMVAVKEVSIEETSSYGILVPKNQKNHYIQAQDIIEKPQTNPPSTIAVMGRYILNPGIFSVLENQKVGIGGEIHLTDAIRHMLPHTPLSGYFFQGERFDCGSKIGWLEANLACALQRKDMAPALETMLTHFLGKFRKQSDC